MVIEDAADPTHLFAVFDVEVPVTCALPLGVRFIIVAVTECLQLRMEVARVLVEPIYGVLFKIPSDREEEQASGCVVGFAVGGAGAAVVGV